VPIHSRRKGAAAEREVRDLLRRAGYHASRDGQITDRFAGPNEDLVHDVRDVHFEVKRRETLALPQWTRQAEDDARGRKAVVVYRRSQEPWRASLDFEYLLYLLKCRDQVERG
jgi:Holliday junction resolvase